MKISTSSTTASSNPSPTSLSVEESTQVVLLIESGPAVLFLAKDHVLAADAFLRSIPRLTVSAIASYTRAPELILDFTPDKIEARQGPSANSASSADSAT